MSGNSLNVEFTNAKTSVASLKWGPLFKHPSTGGSSYGDFVRGYSTGVIFRQENLESVKALFFESKRLANCDLYRSRNNSWTLLSSQSKPRFGVSTDVRFARLAFLAFRR
ncbi:hypothetical protein H310_14234 [Aphanomyces invadans]|uniref:Uncharacterized protein n=1 Tax=Aphanomyces invadans TaxID=157072 RepID=A0A024TBU2_9STRA|nr:hypothetical protein H310_14234 [Aphanomyces invadans]ETV91071.1 hypothetical protein H310_14234 [Aphanomyces invadans]|eukprot:XP_008880267.1 hypothetical protein H310_14234 [Aphanomyces invadans]